MKRFFLALCIYQPGWSLPATPAVGTGVLTRIADIRALSRTEAQKALPVKVRGVVTLKDLFGNPPEWFVVDDGHSSIWVQVRLARDGSVWREGDAKLNALKRGDLIELEGITHPGGYAPVIVPQRYRAMGTQALPEPRDIPLESLLSGTADCQMVDLEGVVQGVQVPELGKDRVTLRMEARGQTFYVITEHWPDIRPDDLIDAVVKVRGIFSPVSNFRAEMVSLRLRIEGAADVLLLKPPPTDPFQASRVSLDRLRPFSPVENSAHRRVTTGVVTYHSPGDFLFVQNGEFGVRVESKDAKVSPGDLVEVAGFVDMTRRVASLRGARVRRTGQGSLPEARSAGPQEVLHPQKVILWERVAETDLDGRLVKMEGKLSRIEWDDDRANARLLIRWSEGSTTAHLRHLSAEQAAVVGSWEPGSRLGFTGVCEIVFLDASTPFLPKPASFRLWLRSPAEVRVLHAPPWWTPARLSQALMLSLLALGLAFGWVFTLRRTLHRRTSRLEEVMSHHRNAELEFQSAQRERLRLAHDLHDGFQQLLAGAMYRLSAARKHLPNSPKDATEQLETAQDALQHTQSGLRNAMWGLTEVAEGPPDFSGLLRHAARHMDHWQDRVEVRCIGRERAMSAHLMGNLLMLFQEAVGNAIRHGQATVVDVEARFDEGGLTLSIQDNGSGFDTSSVPVHNHGHLGLSSMVERMRWLGGMLTITSQPGQGTKVVAFISWEKAEALAKSPLRGVDQPPVNER